MTTEISFVIHWVWVVWVGASLLAVAIVGGVGFFLGYLKGDSVGYKRGLGTDNPSKPPRLH